MIVVTIPRGDGVWGGGLFCMAKQPLQFSLRRVVLVVPEGHGPTSLIFSTVLIDC